MNIRSSLILIALLALWRVEHNPSWLLASIVFVLWLLACRFENWLWLKATGKPMPDMRPFARREDG